jgi:DNA-binding NarL/FixJ family response regulator
MATRRARDRTTRSPPLQPPGDLHAASLRIGGETLFVLSQPVLDGRSFPDLTAAEANIVAALLSGLSNAEIARARRRSVRTIGNQVASIFRKLGVASRAELLAASFRDT